MSTVVSQLAGLADGPVPEKVRAGICSRIIDIVGIAGRASTLETSQAVIGFAVDQGTAPQATAIGAPRAVSAAEAAFVNGVLAHSLDYDDTHLPSILHPSAPVVPAALAVAEWQSASGAALLDAVAVGLETTVRLGMGGYDPQARQSVYFERGQHATSICGAVGSAAAAGRLLQLGRDGIAHAMGIACSMASGIIEANRAGGTVKRLHCGWAARAGVTAAQLAARGITAPPTAIEGRFGLFQAFLGDQSNLDAVTAALSDRWHCDEIFYKPYPANHFTHTGIDAAMALRRRGVCASDVVCATLEVAPPTVRTIGEPIEAKRKPESGYQAQFSGPYTVVAGLLGGAGLGVGLDDFSDALAADPLRRELMARVDVAGDPRLMEIYPNQLPARLSVTTTSAETLVEEVLANRGGPNRPLSTSELAAKYTNNTAGLLPSEVAARIHERLSGLSDIDSVDGLLDPLQRTRLPEVRP
ncbi:MAG: MmgE/PrpD family protein [Acidimicrobiaceae bacterium]|nr:MmgE/PrpD family protein [Acidimicrobiia bacterium]MCY4494498.1 MmgE/PrpD family protein [Acidimicrobiaceae bacterium]